jgi:hypothetical protein
MPLGDAGAYSLLLRIEPQLAGHYPNLFAEERGKLIAEQGIVTVSRP